jgi:hypothetical protein
MMAFISYSLPDEQEYIVSNLVSKLKEQGFYSSLGSYYFKEDIINDETFFKMKAAHFFIGILMPTEDLPTALNAVNKRVITEWEHANSRKIPALLLIDEGIELKLNKPLSNSGNIIPFDKYNPEKAIAFIGNALKEAQRPLENDKTNVAAWILGGDSILALIGYIVRTVQKEQLIAA